MSQDLSKSTSFKDPVYNSTLKKEKPQEQKKNGSVSHFDERSDQEDLSSDGIDQDRDEEESMEPIQLITYKLSENFTSQKESLNDR